MRQGRDKGKTGVVAHAFPSKGQILVEGINTVKRHQKSRRGGQKGQTIEKAMPFPASKAMIVDPKSDKGTRVRLSRDGGKSVRIATKSGAVIS